MLGIVCSILEAACYTLDIVKYVKYCIFYMGKLGIQSPLFHSQLYLCGII